MVAINNSPAESVTTRLMREVAETGPLTLGQVGKMFANSERPKGISYQAMVRLIVNGAKAFDGSRVRLEAIRPGSKWLTTKAAVERFIAARSSPAEAKSEARSPAERKRASDHAAKELEALGV